MLKFSAGVMHGQHGGLMVLSNNGHLEGASDLLKQDQEQVSPFEKRPFNYSYKAKHQTLIFKTA